VKTSTEADASRVRHLVERFTEICLAQYDAKYVIDVRKYNRLFPQMLRVREELKAMPGDQRSALLPLLSHANVQVRLMAAHALLALYPDRARHTLEDIRVSDIDPQNSEAASAIDRLDEGSYVPK
jgi:hypothetical protein